MKNFFENLMDVVNENYNKEIATKLRNKDVACGKMESLPDLDRCMDFIDNPVSEMTISEIQEDIFNLRAEVGQKTSKIKELEAKIVRKDNIINELQEKQKVNPNEVDALHKIVKNLQSENKTLSDELQFAEEDKFEVISDNEKLRSELSERDDFMLDVTKFNEFKEKAKVLDNLLDAIEEGTWELKQVEKCKEPCVCNKSEVVIKNGKIIEDKTEVQQVKEELEKKISDLEESIAKIYYPNWLVDWTKLPSYTDNAPVLPYWWTKITC